jgi:hypothetical protein
VEVHVQVVAEYFPLEHCLSGLNVLTTRLFGMALREVPLAQGEGWANGVRKFVLTHHDEVILTGVFAFECTVAYCVRRLGVQKIVLLSARQLKGREWRKGVRVALPTHFMMR